MVITLALAGILSLTVKDHSHWPGVFLILGAPGGMLGLGLVIMGLTWIAPVVGDGLVFPDSRGGPLRRSNLARRTFKPAVRASVGEPRLVHDLRHTHAASLIANGEHPKTIQSRLGHASIKTTLDRHGHLMPGLDKAVAGRLAGPVKHSGSTQPDDGLEDSLETDK